MNRFLKIALMVLGVFVALVAIAAIVLPMVVDPNDYKGQITAAVEEKTGRELEIPGDIRLTVFPWLGVQLGEVRLANAEGFGDQPFAEIGSAGVRVKLLPLLRKRIEIGTVTLTDMHLRLARKADGTTNWDDLVEAFAAEEETQPEEPAPEEEGFTMPDLEIEAVKIENAAVVFDDRQAGERYEISEFNLSTGRLRSGATFPVETSFVVAAQELGLSVRNKLVAQVEPDLESRFVRVPKFNLEVTAKGDSLPKGEQQFALSGDGEFDAQAGRLEVSNLLLQAVGVNIAGEFSGNDMLAEPEFNGRITVKTFSPRSVMQRLGLEKIETRDSSVLTEAGLDAQFEGTMERVSFDQILIELDDSSFKGEAAVRNFDNPAITFQMSLDQMDVDRYLPPESDGGDKASESAGGDEEAAEIDLEPLKALKLDGRLTAGKLKVANLNVEDAELAVTANNGVLRIQPLGANLYGGNLRMQSTVDAAGKRPTYAIKGDLNSLHFGPLLKDLIGTEKLEALANLTVDLTTSGTTTQQMLRSLDGSIAFDFRDGVFNGFNLPRMLEAARAQFRDKGETDVSPAGKTEFSRFAASFNVNDGVLAGRDLSMRSEKVAAEGAGRYDLAANKLDYTVNTQVLEGASGKLAELEGLTVPIKLSGDLFSPRFSIDIKGALEGVARQKLQEEKQELRQKADDKIQEEKKEIEGKIQEEMKEGLNKLFGGDKKKKQQEPEEEPAAETEGGGGE